VIEDHFLTQHEVERSTVGEESRGSEAIASQLDLVFDVLQILARPALLLRAETHNKLASSIQFAGHLSLTLQEDIKLVLLGLLSGVELLQLLGDLLEGSQGNGELTFGLILGDLHFLRLLLLRLDTSEDVVVFVCCISPLEQA